jgi:hypothetical protein
MLKLKYLWALLLLPLIWLLLIASVAIPAIGHAKSYIKAVQGDYTAQNAKSSADLLTSDINRAFALLNTPIAKQLSSLLGVNFSNIKDEIQAGIAAGAVLAGADEPKKYLIAFQNSAEARGTGGILGAYAVVELNQGKITVIKTGSNEALKWIDEIPIKMPNEFTSLYRSDPAIWQNSNLSPHFPYGAKIWLALWKNQFGQSLDGVIAVDPSALSYILKATGPITLPSGKLLTSENLVAQTLSTAYKEYEKDNAARKQYLVSIINATFKQLLDGEFSKLQMARALQRGIIENRILVYSTESDVEAELAKTRLAGFMQTTPSNQYRVVVQNIDASKLDYYLDRDISIKSLSCEDSPEVEVSVTVKNSLTSGVGLPAYVLTRADKSKPAKIVAGQHRFLLFIYGPPQSKLISATRSSTTGSAGGMGEERTRPILVVDLDLPPSQEEKITAVFTRGYGPISYHSQPLVIEEKVSINDKCK